MCKKIKFSIIVSILTILLVSLVFDYNTIITLILCNSIAIIVISSIDYYIHRNKKLKAMNKKKGLEHIRNQLLNEWIND